MLPKRGKSQLDRSEICTEVSFTTAEVMRTLIMKLPHTEVKFYPEVKCQTGLSSLQVSCKRALTQMIIFLTRIPHCDSLSPAHLYLFF